MKEITNFTIGAIAAIEATAAKRTVPAPDAPTISGQQIDLSHGGHVFAACCDSVPQGAIDIYNTAKALRDLLTGGR